MYEFFPWLVGKVTATGGKAYCFGFGYKFCLLKQTTTRFRFCLIDIAFFDSYLDVNYLRDQVAFTVPLALCTGMYCIGIEILYFTAILGLLHSCRISLRISVYIYVYK